MHMANNKVVRLRNNIHNSWYLAIENGLYYIILLIVNSR